MKGPGAEEITQRISIEGADPPLLGNDVNLTSWSGRPRPGLSAGESLTITGTVDQVERAATVAQGLLDIARIGEAVSVEDVYRFA